MAKKKESRKVAIEAVRTNRKRLLTNESPFAIKEAYVKLRTSLMFCMTADKERPCTSFAVTSAKPSEGKSLTAANIAISYAMLGKKVLLIDADMRKPTQRRLWRVEKPIGRKISIQTAILSSCSQRSMPWQRSMICQSFTPATPEAESGWRRRDSSWTPV